MISRKSIDEVLDRVRIEEVVQDFVNLKRRGTNLIGLCPFHHEKTPSFSVSPTKNIFKCFGCGVGGNALTFLMARENLDFPAAVRRLATRTGVELPEAGESRARWQALYEANAFAAEFYARELRDSPEGAAASEYLVMREVDDSAREAFQLGWAPSSWDSLLSAARAAGIRVRFPFLDPTLASFTGRLGPAMKVRARSSAVCTSVMRSRSACCASSSAVTSSFAGIAYRLSGRSRWT